MNRLIEIEEKIYEFAGEKFNINSPKQLGVILFEKLDLPAIKENKNRIFHFGRCIGEISKRS